MGVLFFTFVTTIMFALFIDWVNYVGRPQNSSDFTPGDGTNMVRSARFQTCVYAHESVYLNNPCRLNICTFIPSFTSGAFASSLFNSKRTLFLHFYADKSVQFDVFFKYTFLYVYIRLKTLLWKFSRFQVYVYIRIYTYANAYLEVLEISNIRLYTIIYV